MMFLAAMVDSLILPGAVVLLVLLKMSAIMFLRTRDAYIKKLDELKQEEN